LINRFESGGKETKKGDAAVEKKDVSGILVGRGPTITLIAEAVTADG